MEITWCEVRAIEWMIKHLPAELLQEICWPSSCVLSCSTKHPVPLVLNGPSQFLQCFTVTLCRAHSPTFPSLHLHHSSFSNPSVALPTSQLILQPFCHFTYITAHSPTLLSLYLHHSSFSNLSVTSLTSQLILQPFHHFTYFTAHSPTHLLLYLHNSSFPTLLLLHLRHSSFSNPSFASLTYQVLHIIHLASRPCYR